MSIGDNHITYDTQFMEIGKFNIEHDIDICISHLKNGKLLSESTLKYICKKLMEITSNEKNINNIHAPVTVVGDIHGQYYDLLELFKIGGECPYTNYLFLGDYVDRGPFSVEVISYLACLKVRYPSRISLLRGNHESRQTTQVYGFYADCLRKYGGPNVWEYFTNWFDTLPIGATIDGRIFCVHAGLSPSLHSLDQLRTVDRFQEIPHEGLMADVMWSDPDVDHTGFRQSNRGAGYTFGRDVVDQFCQWNSLDCILRAHQLCMIGYQVLFDDKFATVWSAPNYCYRVGNLASILEIDDKHGKFFNVFASAPVSANQQPQNTENLSYFDEDKVE